MRAIVWYRKYTVFVSPSPLCGTRKILFFCPYPMVWYQKLMSVSVSAVPSKILSLCAGLMV